LWPEPHSDTQHFVTTFFLGYVKYAIPHAPLHTNLEGVEVALAIEL
jgi:hypothetical protein